MKTTYTVLLFFVCSNIIKAQIANIPDTTFLNHLLFHHDLNKDGQLQVREAEQIKGITITTVSSIKSLEGIAYLKNLENLHITSNFIDSIDLSSNLLLRTIVLIRNKTNNIKIGKLIFLEILSVSQNNLEVLDVFNSPLLTRLWCSQNKLKTFKYTKQY